METKTKPKILINPPPADHCCEMCGRNKDQLPRFPKDSTFSEAYLVKTYRGGLCIGASWECYDCLNCDDIYSFYGDEDNDLSNEERMHLHKQMEKIRISCKEALDKEKYFFNVTIEMDGVHHSMIYPVKYWSAMLGLRKLNLKNET